MSDQTLPPPRYHLELIPPSEQEVSLERILQLLEKGKIGAGQGRLRWSSNYTFLVTVCDEDFEARAIYKPRQGERPLWDFPDGTLCQREYAAFLVSEALGWSIVPPTLLREGPRGMGSIQLYIEHNPEITYFNLGESFLPQLQRIAIFDYLTNNADRKGGHCLLGVGSKVWGIDHGICFHVAPKLRTVIWEYAGSDLPSELIPDIRRLQDNSAGLLQSALRGLISDAEMDAFNTRIERLLHSNKFPEPGYGPSYPWPPV